MKKLIIKLLFWNTLLPCSLLFANLDTLFSSGINSIKEGSLDQGIHSLIEWNERAKERSISSPEVHHNLAVAYAEKGDYLNSSKELLEATRLSILPNRRLEELEHLRDVQRHLGISQSTLERTSALILLAISREIILFLLLTSIWLFILFYYFRITHRKGYAFLPISGVAILIVFLSILLSSRIFGTMGVLDGTDEISVYADTKLNEKIITLPPGTLVRIRRNKSGIRQILEPVYGWVKTEDCLTTPLPASVGLWT